MNKALMGGIVIVAVVAVGVGIYSSSNSKNDVVVPQEQTEQKPMEDKKMFDEKGTMEKGAMEEKDAMMKAGDTKADDMVKKDETSMMNKGETMMKAGSYEAYSADKLARAENGDVVLFFHASWCPSCRGLNSDIEKNVDSIPAGVSILKMDYDKEVDLKKKYGVTYQHTLVQVDKNGNLIKKWSGSPKLINLVSEIN